MTYEELEELLARIIAQRTSDTAPFAPSIKIAIGPTAPRIHTLEGILDSEGSILLVEKSNGENRLPSAEEHSILKGELGWH